MRYDYGGENLIEDRYYRAISLEEARAKFAYFRDAEAWINGGPVFILNLTGCGSDIGYYRHLRLREERCRECKDAHAAIALKRYWDKKKRNDTESNLCAPQGHADDEYRNYPDAK